MERIGQGKMMGRGSADFYSGKAAQSGIERTGAQRAAAQEAANREKAPGDLGPDAIQLDSIEGSARKEAIIGAAIKDEMPQVEGFQNVRNMVVEVKAMMKGSEPEKLAKMRDAEEVKAFAQELVVRYFEKHPEAGAAAAAAEMAKIAKAKKRAA